MDDAFRRLIIQGKSEHELYEAAMAAGMQSLRESALEKMKAGQTSAAEILKSVYLNI